MNILIKVIAEPVDYGSALDLDEDIPSVRIENLQVFDYWFSEGEMAC